MQDSVADCPPGTIVPVYEVCKVTDDGCGVREFYQVIAVCSDKNTAMQFSKGFGMYGRDGRVRQRTGVITTNGSVALIQEGLSNTVWEFDVDPDHFLKKEMKEKALAKLTLEERRLLGL